MIRLLFAAAPLLALAACASDGVTAQPTQTAQAEAGQKVVCEREQRTGSMLGKRECAPALSEDDKRRLSNEVGNMVKPRGTTAPGT
ncbi:hypothetical protein [Roseateles noduli]|uniref:hypothetical protein n=1 Tax=Roseateles noduli TaxID=2052484 RepID=UPI003D64D7CE